MTEIKDKNGNLKGYEIGNSISVHWHITDPESWFITIRPLQIFSQSLCPKTCTQVEIARYISVLLGKKIVTITSILKEVTPHT